MWTMNEYQKWAGSTDMSPGTSWYYALGLNGEAGEVAELIKKAYRGNVDVNITELANELGDVLWYLTRLASYYQISLEDVVQANRNKLEERKRNGRITG